MTEQIKKLKELVDGSDNIVFFGGAGVSTEPGIPDFRSTDGLYHQQWDYPPEVILSHTFYESNPEAFFRFYRAKMLAPDARPNDAHRKLAQWEQEGKLKAVITQNIDGLHQAAGSKNVLELHGSVHRNHCQRCGKFYPLDALLHGEGGYLHRETEVLLSVVSNHELPKIERLARSIDPECFLIISRVTEVWGRGFSYSKKRQ